MVTKYSVAMGLIAVADPDLQIRGRGGRSSRPLDGGGAVLNFFFSTFQAPVWSKNNGRPGPPGPLPAWICYQWLLNCQPNLKIVSRYYHVSNNTKQWKKTDPPWVAGLLLEFKSNYWVSVKLGVAAWAEVGVYPFF